ncbi:MAG TPA: PQQ-dependent sugar dehydrogenase [Phycisphaerae bacterium]|nr:PQQ-dependent sugar dehydrogenase [Phycisphaerae bacterium]
MRIDHGYEGYRGVGGRKRRGVTLVESLERRVLMTTLPTGFREMLVAGGLGETTAMDVLPDGRVLVSSQLGRLELVPANGGAATTALTLTVDSDGERGLLGVAHDPNFGSNHFIYLYHTVPVSGSANAFNEVTRYTMNGDIADPSSAVDILKLNDLSPATNHNGGSLHFGADGKLYLGVGENANPENSQTLSNLLGKVLRIDVSQIVAGDPVNDVAKLVPADNPFLSRTSGINGAIYALGFRNPFTFAVNSNGTIYINDVGQNTWEEIDQLRAGGNYGWGLSEGFNGGAPAGLGPGTYVEPLLAYNHNGGPAGGGIAIIGGVMYRAAAGAAGGGHPFPAAFNGKYFYSDLGGDWIRVLDPAKPGSRANPDTSSGFATGIVDNPVAFSMAADGGIYYLSRGSSGELLKISYVGNPPTITRQPHAVLAMVGQSATFTVNATGSGKLTYQWQRSIGGGRFAGIPGAVSSTLTLKGLKLADSGSRFRLVVRSAGGETVSNAVYLTVKKGLSAKLEIV